jgi:hypothetical protein
MSQIVRNTPSIFKALNQCTSSRVFKLPLLRKSSTDAQQTNLVKSSARNWELFLSYQQSLLNNSIPFFTPHPQFRPLFLFNRGKRGYCLNYKQVYSRWLNTSSLVVNIFVKQLNPFMFMTQNFRTEVTAFNWASSPWDYQLFKKVAPYFFLKEARYGQYTHHIFLELEKTHNLTSFITNVRYHEKNIHFLKRFGGYTIGAVSINANPWLVSYPIPVGLNTPLTEYFFLSLVCSSRQYAEWVHFKHSLFLWKNL